MGILRRTPDGKRFISLAHLCHNAARLHCNRGKTLIHQALLDDDTAIGQRLGKSLVYVISRRMYAKWDIGTKLLIEQSGAWLHGFFHINNGWQRLIIDFNQIACVASCIAVLRNHEGDGITVESYFALGQWTTNAHPFGNFSQGNGNSNVTQYPFDICSGVNSYNAGIFAGSVSVYTFNVCMPIRAAKYSHVEHAGKFDIINVGGLTGDQARIFTPFNRRTKHSCNAHVYAYPFSSRGSKVLRTFRYPPGATQASPRALSGLRDCYSPAPTGAVAAVRICSAACWTARTMF